MTQIRAYNGLNSESILKNHAFYYPAGEGRTSFIDLRDVAQAVAEALLSDNYFNQTFTLTGSEALNYYQAAEILSAETVNRISYIDTVKYPEYQPDYIKNDVISQNFFGGVKENVYERITLDLIKITKRKARTLQQYAREYWRHYSNN